MTDIQTHKLYAAIATKMGVEKDEIDGDVFAEKFTLEELAILQKELAKAINRKVLG